MGRLDSVLGAMNGNNTNDNAQAGAGLTELMGMLGGLLGQR